MATGKSGSLELTGTKGFIVRVEWSETYDVGTNKSNVSIDSLSVKSTRYSSAYYPSGTITINGTTAITFDSRLGTHAVYATTSGFSPVAANGDNDPAPWSVSGIAHNSDGSKSVTIAVNITGYTISGGSGSGWSVDGSKVITLTTIPRKSTLSVANGTLGTAQTLTVTKQATGFTHTITAKCGSASTTVCTKSASTSVSFTPPIAWASQNTTGTTVSVTYTIETFNGSTSIGSNSYTKTCSIPASVKPSCELTVTDPTGYADEYGGYLKGLSKFKVVISATKAYDSAIASYKTTANGSTYTASSFTTGALSNSGTLTINSTVTDKRGRTGTASESIIVLNYDKPLITELSVHRCNQDGTANDQGEYVQVIFSSSVTPLSNKNQAAYTIEYKKTTDSTYHVVCMADYANNYSVSNASYIFAADSGSSYNVRVTVTDNFETSLKVTSASTGFTIMHWLASGLGMAIGKVAELTGVLDIGFKTRFFGGILHPVLEPETDLDDVRTPNTYVGADISRNNYGNCPLTSGTFTLEVVGMGEEGQVKQRLTYCHKTSAKAWERIYYGSSWGEWICVSDFDGQLLWSGVYYMTGSQTATLSEPISKQRSGIVLVFSRYSSDTAQNYHFQTFFVPKLQIANHTGCGHTFMMTTDGSFGLFAAKYLYINDATIVGNEINNTSGTGACGITYDNAGFVLRYVIGV
jgi:hypothetical protein